MSTDSALGIVAVTYFPGETVMDFLRSIESAADWSVSGRPHVLVADNGSTDGSLEAIEESGLAEVLRTGSNLGFGGGANAGVQALPPQVSWVLVCNSDLTFAPGAIDELMEAARRYPGAGALGPMLVTTDQQPYPSARELPSLGRGIGHALLGWVWSSNPWTRSYRRDHEIPSERPAGWLSGACLLLRRNAFERVGGFDPAYFMYFEDVDLGERLTLAGWQNIYVPSARVTHIGGHSTARHQTAMSNFHHESAYRYLSKKYGAWWQSPIRLLLKVGLKLRGAAAKRSERIARAAALPTAR